MEEEDFTVECWVYSTSSSGTQNVCQIYGTGGKYYGIYWNGSSLRYYVTGTGGPGDVSAGDIVFGKIDGIILLLLEMEAPSKDMLMVLR